MQYKWHLPENEFDSFAVSISKEEVVFKGLKILDVLRRIPKFGVRRMKEENCPPGTGTYNSLIFFYYILVGDFDECMKYYNSMLSNNCEPNVDTYTRIITANAPFKAWQMWNDFMHVGGSARMWV